MCNQLRELPNGIPGMGSLRHLDVTSCGSLEKLPDGIGRLTLLQTLNKFQVVVVGGGEGRRSNIGELGGLNRLRGHLSITNLEVVRSVEEARTAKLQDKTSLESTELRWAFSHRSMSMSVLESLHPPPRLETLRIIFYPGGAFPGWMGDGSAFPHLSHVELLNCRNCTQLPPLGQLPCLKSLRIWALSGVKKVGEEFLHLGLGRGDDDDEGGTSIVAFPQLESLTFIAMGCWERWASPLSSWSSSSIVKKAANAEATILPRLNELRIESCPKLEGMLPPIFTTALQTLRIADCPVLGSLQFLPPSIQRLELAGVSTEKLLADCPTTLLPALKHLSIGADSELTTADQLSPTLLHLSALQSLRIIDCENLRTLPEGLTRLTNLQKLEIYRCTPELRESCEVGGRLWPRIAHIPLIRIDSREVQNNAC